MKNLIKYAAAAIFTVSAITPALAEDVQRTELGVLECTIEGGLGLLLGSKKDAVCSFVHKEGTLEVYTGSLSKLGLDIGVSGDSFMSWVVFTPLGNEVGSYALQGDYVGVSAGAAIGLGLGANALVGGSDKKFGLQPLSIEGKTGLNVAIGLAKLSLRPAR